MSSFYPVMVSDKLVETVNFYEDYLGFAVVIEKEGYALLQSTSDASICIAVCDVNHCALTGIQSVQGLILTLPADDVGAAYDRLYMEGLDIYKELGENIHGNAHFIITDPNGVLVNVSAPLELEAC